MDVRDLKKPNIKVDFAKVAREEGLQQQKMLKAKKAQQKKKQKNK